MTKNLFNKIIMFAVIIGLLILAPFSINTPSQTTVRAVCTGFAIDKNQADLEISAQILIPQAGGEYSQQLSLVTNKGKTLEDALEQMEYQVGKKVRFAHCCYIILGKNICNENVTKTLDYFMRGNNLGNNTLLIFTDKNAKDLLTLTTNINSNEVDNLQIITKFNERHLFSNNANLESFYHDYLSPHQTSYMGNITIQSVETEKSSDQGDKEKNEENAQNKPTKDLVTSNGSVAVFYKGKCACVLSNEQREFFNWLDTTTYNTLVKVPNITDKVLKNATMAFTLIQKKMKWRFDIQNNTPTIYIDYDLGLHPEMIIQNDGSTLPVYNDYISDAVQIALSKQINTSVQNAMKIQKQYGFDVFNFYKSFNTKCHQKWQAYLSTLPDKQDYIKNISVYTNVSCHNTI